MMMMIKVTYNEQNVTCVTWLIWLVWLKQNINLLLFMKVINLSQQPSLG